MSPPTVIATTFYPHSPYICCISSLFHYFSREGTRYDKDKDKMIKQY